jgi:hypothetical protein
MRTTRLLIILLLATTAVADELPCPYFPSRPDNIYIRIPGGVVAGQPARFSLGSYASEQNPVAFVPTFCDHTTWDFGDGSPTVTALSGQTVSHVFARGKWVVTETTASVLGTVSISSPVFINSDPPAVVTADSVTASEGPSSVPVTLHRTGNLTTTVSVSFSTDVPSSTYVPLLQHTQGTVIFAPGETVHTVSIPLANDSLYGGPDVSHLTLDSNDGTWVPTSTDPTASHALAVATITVIDDEPPGTLVVHDVASVEGPAGAAGTHFVSIPAFITGGVTREVDFDFSLIGGTATPGADFPQIFYDPILSILPGHSYNDVLITGDDVPEGDETIVFRVRGDANGPQVTQDHVTVTILDDDAGFIPGTLQARPGEMQHVRFHPGLRRGAPLTIHFSSSAPDIVAAPADVILPAGASTFDLDLQPIAAGLVTVSPTLSDGQPAAPLVLRIEDGSPATLSMEPQSVTISEGTTADVALAFLPTAGVPRLISLGANDPTVADVPPSVTVPPGGSGHFTVRGLREGTTYVFAAADGGVTATLAMKVVPTSKHRAIGIHP